MKRVIFEEKPFSVKFDGSKRLCRSSIVENDISMDAVFQCDQHLLVFMIVPGNIILAWRTIKAVQHIGLGDQEHLALYTISMNEREVVNDLVDKEIFDKIMSEPVPKELVKAVIERRNPWEICKLRIEVMSGTIAYDPEMEKVGIVNPNQKMEREEKLVTRLKPHIDAYAEFIGLTDKNTLSFFEGTAISFVNMTEGGNFCDEGIVAAAGVSSFDQCDEKGVEFPCFPDATEPVDQAYIMTKSIEWLVKVKKWEVGWATEYMGTVFRFIEGSKLSINLKGP